ncbi:MAG: hypothetical protein EXS24_07430 [Pedosphaera sp.]|nr:hypothetical protein [Pedosphaera sp.]
MVEKPYLQFPLCALAYGQAVDARLNAILDYGLVDKGWKLFSKLSAEQRRQFLSKVRQARRIPEGCDTNNWSHCGALYGAEIIGVTIHCFLPGIESYQKLRDHVVAFEKAHGRDALVRVKKGWVFDTRDGHGITYREFSVLCAIYSAIGDKELAIVTRDRIRRCALGYRTAAIMQAELPRRADKAQPLTERQLRDTITRLHRNKFFARCTVARRITYYSIRLDNEAMRKKVLERRTYPGFFHASQAVQDQALTAAIKQKRRETAQTVSKPPPLAPRFLFKPTGQTG